MQEKIGQFWKYASTLKQASTLEDVFLKWAASNKLLLKDAQNLWNEIAVATANAFNKKKADVTIETSTPAEMQEMFKTVQESNDVGVSETNSSGLPPAMEVEPKEDTKTLLQALEEPDEETGVAPTNEAAGVTPPPPTEGLPAGGLPPLPA